MKHAEYKTGQLLTRLGNLVTWFRNQELHSKNLTSEQAGIIGLLQKAGNPGLSESQLAKELNLSKATVSEIVRKMEHKSFLQRREDPDDRRRKCVFLTAQGASMEAYLGRVARKNEEIMFWGMTDEEQQELNRLLEMVLKNMNDCRVCIQNPLMKAEEVKNVPDRKG